MAAILNSAILNLAILESAILVFLLKLTHTCQDWVPPFAQKNFTLSFWLILMMAAILNSAMFDLDTAILDSDTLLSSLIFTQKHSSPILNLTQTNSIWLKLIHSDSTWWCSHLEFCHLGWANLHIIKLHSFISFKLMMAAILKSALLDSATATLLSSLRFTQKHSHSTLTLTQTN